MARNFETRLRRSLVDRLYSDSMLLADEARGYFDDFGRVERDGLPPLARVTFSCESLKVTTRLMHSIAWLLTQRAVIAGELQERDALDPSRRLGTAPISETQGLAGLPATALALVRASEDLHRRVARLDEAQIISTPLPSPVLSLQNRLETAF